MTTLGPIDAVLDKLTIESAKELGNGYVVYARGMAYVIDAVRAALSSLPAQAVGVSETVLVKQRSNFDCGVCCLAMITGRDYDDVLAAVGDAYDPLKGMANTSKALGRIGIPQRYYADQHEAGAGHSFLHRHVVGAEFFRTFAWGRRALMSVPSLNYVGDSHLVYWDGLKVFDPSNKLTYTSFDQLLPEEITLFREAALRITP